MIKGDTLLISTRKGLFVLKRGSRNGWQQTALAHAGVSVNHAARNPYTGEIWACLDHGHWGPKLSVSADEGNTWRPVPTPSYPQGSQYLASWDATDVRTAQLFFIWTLAFTQDSIWVGTEPGGLFESRDNGESFELNTALWSHPSRLGENSGWFGGGRGEGRGGPGIHSILIDPADALHQWVGISCAGVFETADGGLTWIARNKGMTVDYMPESEPEFGHDPHCLHACFTQPEVIWQQNHCGIFRSTDGAKTWTPVSRKGVAPHFGFPIAADEEDPELAWVIPGTSEDRRVAANGRLRVYRSEDGGKSWEGLDKGLPDAPAYDVVLRQALCAHYGKLAFGSTTGNAFVSTDKGNNWQALGNHYPPIYSLNFA